MNSKCRNRLMDKMPEQGLNDLFRTEFGTSAAAMILLFCY